MAAHVAHLDKVVVPSWALPAGNPAHAAAVEAVTNAVAILGAVALLWAMIFTAPPQDRFRPGKAAKQN